MRCVTDNITTFLAKFKQNSRLTYKQLPRYLAEVKELKSYNSYAFSVYFGQDLFKKNSKELLSKICTIN